MDYVKVILVIAPQFISGCLLYLLLLKRPEVGLVELLSIGSVLGIISSTIVDQIFVNLQLPKIGWLVSILVIVISFVVCQLRGAIVFATILWQGELTKSLLPIAAIATMALGVGWYWLFPSGVLFVVAAFVFLTKSQRYSRAVIRILIFGAVIAGIFMFIKKPGVWFIFEDADNSFLQALSRSISNYGINNYVLLSGNPTRYHWFTYAWIGLIDRVSDAETFFVFNKVVPLVFVALTSGVIWGWIDRYSTSKIRTFVMALVAMTFSSYAPGVSGQTISILSYSSPSQQFGVLLIFTSVFLLLQAGEFQLRLAPFLCVVMASATTLTKTHDGLVLLGSLSALLFANLIWGQEGKGKKSKLYLLSIASVFSTYAIFIASSAASRVSQIRPGEFIWTLLGDGRNLSNNWVNIIGGFFVVGTASPAIILALLSMFSENIRKREIVVANFGALSAGLFLGYVILGDFGENLVFLHSAIGLSIVLGLVVCASYPCVFRINTLKVALYFAAGVILIWLTYLIPDINSGAKWPIIFRYARFFTVPFLILFTASILLVFHIFTKRKITSQLISLTLIIFSMSFLYTFKHWNNDIKSRYEEFDRVGYSYIGTDAIIEVSSGINPNTDQTTIVASNFGWPKIKKSDLEFFSTPCTATRSKEPIVEVCRRTNDALLVAYVKRKVWLQATKFHYSGMTPEIERRQTATLGFVSAPTQGHLKQMLDDGVGWFVVDRSTTDLISWEPFATIRYKNDSFSVLELSISGSK